VIGVLGIQENRVSGEGGKKKVWRQETEEGGLKKKKGVRPFQLASQTPSQINKVVKKSNMNAWG